jgi:hypothetical protein
LEETDMLVHDLNVTAGEGNIETMLAVDKGLKELALLKVLMLFHWKPIFLFRVRCSEL